jgi:hypothetical protein
MATLPVIVGIGQKCPSCGQRSSPKPGRGDWEVMGIWNGTINKCTKCGSLLRIGLLFDELLNKEDSEKFLSFSEELKRKKQIVFYKQGALSTLVNNLFGSSKS